MYLSRYGVAFHMEVNLAPLRLISMFDYRPYTEDELRATRAAKLARIQQLKTKLSDLLVANSQELAAVPQEQQIAVVDPAVILLAGATAVGVGTGLFYDPLLLKSINAGLLEYLDRHGMANVGELSGALRLNGA